jgi:hypothetical protein
MHIKKMNQPKNFNLPRLFWAKKSWTLAELHHRVFDHLKNLFYRWYCAVNEGGLSRSRHDPEYEWNGKKIDIHSLCELFEIGDLEVQFKAFFPILNEENWKDVIGNHY